MAITIYTIRTSVTPRRLIEGLRRTTPAIKPFMPEKHFLVALPNTLGLLAFVKQRGEICLKFIYNGSKEALVFEGKLTFDGNHAQHNALANEVWGDYGYRFSDVRGGFLHIKHDNGKFTMNFYGYSSTFAQSASGDVDHDSFVAGNEGLYCCTNAARKLTRVLSDRNDIKVNQVGIIDTEDLEINKSVKAVSIEIEVPGL